MKKTICLNMIVKNESPVIQRCLMSVKKFIDYWVIVDTGSTDQTKEIIEETMRDIPGQLHERPWVNFSHNRNEALALAKHQADYLLFIDADEKWEYSVSFSMPDLYLDQYLITIKQPDGMTYYRPCLVKSSLDWKWKGVLHEEIQCLRANQPQILPGVVNISNTEEGHRWQDPDKYLKDAQVLEKGLSDEPENSRYVFYLALSYGKAHKYELSLKYHQKRVAMGGSKEEVFYSLLNIAKIQEGLNASPEIFINSYINAYLYRPTRAEPLYFLANYYINHENLFLGYILSKLGLEIPYPKDIVFVLHPIYESGLLLQFVDCSYAIGKYQESCAASEKLLSNPHLSLEMKNQIRMNMSHLKSKIKHENLSQYDRQK